MGFEKPRYSFDSKRDPPKRSTSVVDNLFEDPPKLDRNVSMPNAASDNNEQLDVSFGGYVPSAVNNTPRTKQRNVKFMDDLFNTDTSNERPKTTPTQPAIQTQNFTKQNEPAVNPLTKSLPASKSGYDWLGIADNDKTNEANNDWLKPRERSVPPVVQQQTSSRPNDWLGIKDSQNSSFEKENFDFDPPKPKVQQKGNVSLDGSIDEPKQKPPKAILNSSFADSIDNLNNNNNNNVNNYQNSNNPVYAQALALSMKAGETASESGSDIADAWLNNLMSSKKNPPKLDIPQLNGIKIVCFEFFFLPQSSLSYWLRKVLVMFWLILILDYLEQS
jgi:hypothetical protein